MLILDGETQEPTKRSAEGSKVAIGGAFFRVVTVWQQPARAAMVEVKDGGACSPLSVCSSAGSRGRSLQRGLLVTFYQSAWVLS